MKGKYIDIDGQELTYYLYSDTGLVIIRRYFNSNNKLHRLDGPAVEYNDGSFVWWNNGSLHRIGGPTFYSVIYNEYSWYINGKQVEIYYICG